MRLFDSRKALRFRQALIVRSAGAKSERVHGKGRKAFHAGVGWRKPTRPKAHESKWPGLGVTSRGNEKRARLSLGEQAAGVSVEG